MAFAFKLPDLGEGLEEGEIVEWLVEEGDAITEDQPMVKVLTDKAEVEIPSPVAGTVARLHAQNGDKVKVGDTIIDIDED